MVSPKSGVPSSSNETKKPDKNDDMDYIQSLNLKPSASSLTTEEKMRLLVPLFEECIQIEELEKLFEAKEHPICYDGFEPSGRMHIAQALLKAHLVNSLAKCGAIFIFWVADWFSMLNNKFEGDMHKIKIVGEYFIEIWKALDMNMDHVKFLWTSDEINANANEYWIRVMNIARLNTISRVKRCSQIMGRADGDEQAAATILYPCMQCSDIFHLKADICQLGMDQRKVNMLAREYAAMIGVTPPIILSHPILPALSPDVAKMSKSHPESALFVDDTPQEIEAKLAKAFCPPGEIKGNPCVEYVRRIIFPILNEFVVERSESNGGKVSYKNEKEFLDAYESSSLHPKDLKTNLAKQLNRLLDPVRRHFEENSKAAETLRMVRSFSKK